jgi:hypothetical protein
VVGSLLNGTKKLEAIKRAVDEAQARREAYWHKVSAAAAAGGGGGAERSTNGALDTSFPGAGEKALARSSGPRQGGARDTGGRAPLKTDDASSSEPLVAAIYFGDWHVDPQMSALHGPNWTEWQLPIHAQPRYPGHLQPNLPLEQVGRMAIDQGGGRHSTQLPCPHTDSSDSPSPFARHWSQPEKGFGMNVSESDPAVMSKKIESATANGIDMFLFDWYWYASPTLATDIVPDLQGPAGGPFLDAALNEGFLKAPNNEKMQFALMWANQDWVDVHPAKREPNSCLNDAPCPPCTSHSAPIRQPFGSGGWHSTGSSGPGQAVIGRKCRGPAQLQMFSEYMDDQVYRNAFKYIAENYFTKPNYYKAPTKLANGTVADCCFFSIYQPGGLSAG